MGRFALLVAMKHASAEFTRITMDSRNKYEQWSDVQIYLTDNYLDFIDCTGLAQYCKGDTCYGRFNEGQIECFHEQFQTPWDHDDHMWCNCQPLECLDDSRFVIYDDGYGETSGCEKLVGVWKHLQSTSAASSVSFQEGFKRTEGWSFSTTEEFTTSVTETAKAGIAVEGVGSAEASVSTTMSQTLSNTHSESFSEEESESTTQSFDFPEAGTVWQWQYEFYSPRAGSEPVITKTKDLTQTAGDFAPPCCLPGYQDGDTCADGPTLCEETPAPAPATV